MDTKTGKIEFSEKYDTSSLKGRSALVTGGATGIGQGAAVALAEAGAYVTIADINEEAAKETVKELEGKGHHAQFIRTDVLSWASLVAAFKAAIAFSPDNTLDIVIPAAGMANGDARAWVQNTPLDEAGDPVPWKTKVVAINLEAVFNTAHLAMHYFKKFPGPNVSVPKQIIFVASMGGYTSMTGTLDYCTSKWGVRGLFRALRGAQDILGQDKPKLRCNLLAPTFVKTNMTKGFWDYMIGLGIKLAEVSDCTDVIMRIAADEAVVGRAVCVAPEKQSFDLCDDEEGLDAGREVRRSVGVLYGAPQAAKPRKEEEHPNGKATADIPSGVEGQTTKVNVVVGQ